MCRPESTRIAWCGCFFGTVWMVFCCGLSVLCYFHPSQIDLRPHRLEA